MRGRSGGVSSAWWHMRNAFEVCFVGLVVERICVWCLVIVFIFMGFGQAGAKRCGGCLKVISWGWWCKSQKGALLIGKAGSHYVILLYCETLLQVLLGTVKDFIGYLFSLYYCCFTCLRLAKPKMQLKSKYPNDINTEWAIPEKFYFTPKNSISLILPPSPSVCVFLW